MTTEFHYLDLDALDSETATFTNDDGIGERAKMKLVIGRGSWHEESEPTRISLTFESTER